MPNMKFLSFMVQKFSQALIFFLIDRQVKNQMPPNSIPRALKDTYEVWKVYLWKCLKVISYSKIKAMM